MFLHKHMDVRGCEVVERYSGTVTSVNTQDGSYDQPNGGAPQRLDATPYESSSTGSKGFGGVGSFQEPSSPAAQPTSRAIMSCASPTPCIT